MQFCKPMVSLAALGLPVFLTHTLLAQQNSSNRPSSQPTSAKSTGTSHTSVTVPAPDPPKSADTAAGEKKADQSPFRATVNEVIVPVTVTDDKVRFVSDLDKKES